MRKRLRLFHVIFWIFVELFCSRPQNKPGRHKVPFVVLRHTYQIKKHCQVLIKEYFNQTNNIIKFCTKFDHQARLIYRLENNTDDTVNPKQQCLDWYVEQPDPTDWNRLLGTCPCALTQGVDTPSFSRRLGADLLAEISNQNGEFWKTTYHVTGVSRQNKDKNCTKKSKWSKFKNLKAIFGITINKCI